MTPMVYLIPALVVTVFFLVRAGILEKQRQIYVLKPLSTLIVIEVASLSFLQPANTGVRSSFLVFRSDDAGVDGYMPCLRSRICGDRSCSMLQETRSDRGCLGSSRIGFLRPRGVVLG